MSDVLIRVENLGKKYRILAILENYFIGTYPVLSQCFVLEKSEATDD